MLTVLSKTLLGYFRVVMRVPVTDRHSKSALSWRGCSRPKRDSGKSGSNIRGTLHASTRHPRDLHPRSVDLGRADAGVTRNPR